MAMGKMGMDALGLGSLGKPGKMSMGEDSAMVERRAIEDMFSKAAAKDWEGAHAAFKVLYEACSAEHEQGEDDEYPEE